MSNGTLANSSLDTNEIKIKIRMISEKYIAKVAGGFIIQSEALYSTYCKLA